MKKFARCKRWLALCLVLALSVTALCGCSILDVLNFGMPYDDEVIFSTFDLSEENRGALAEADYDLEIIMKEEYAHIIGLPILTYFEYTLTFQVYEKGNPDNMLGEYWVWKNEATIPTCERDPYDIMICDSATEDIPLKMVEIFQTWSRYDCLSVIQAGGIDGTERDMMILANDVRLNSVKTLQKLVTDYGQSFIDEKLELKNILWELAGVVEPFLVEEGIQGWIKGMIICKGEMPDYMDKDKVNGIAEKMGEFMGKESLSIFDTALNYANMQISDRELELCRSNIGICMDEICEAILAAENE